jgi:hypothetical protein
MYCRVGIAIFIAIRISDFQPSFPRVPALIDNTSNMHIVLP